MAEQTDRALLERFIAFFQQRDFVKGDPASIRDMVNRYARPPLTMRYRVNMQMTQNDYDQLVALLQDARAHVSPNGGKDAPDTA